MIVGKSNFLYLSTRVGTTQDGERFVAIDLLDQNDRKHSFMTTNTNLVDELKLKQFAKYSDILVTVGFNKEYNQNRYSYWKAELLGAE